MPAIEVDIARIQHLHPARVVVAVSGGSDSLSLLHILQSQLTGIELLCATVDHNLRPTSAAEADQVARHCASIGISHSTLRWDPAGPANSAEARSARYELLMEFARLKNAQIMALGHTLDDQAETVFMRAQRMRRDSSTFGLSGIAEWATCDDIKLWRPLLAVSRIQLRNMLETKDISWIDDPSNLDCSYERIRVRQLLATNDPSIPNRRDLVRLAESSATARRWLNQQTAQLIGKYAEALAARQWQLKCAPQVPTRIQTEALAWMVQLVGEQDYRPAIAKLAPIIAAAIASTPEPQP